MINETEVLDFQTKWGNGIVNIGSIYKQNGDYKKVTIDFIKDLYSYESEIVFFKPTLAKDVQFRLDFNSALSYFIGDNEKFLEDKGFAIKGWESVRWQNIGVKIYNNIAISMGNYFFMKDNVELKVEYTIVLKKINGKLKMILHDSHLPYNS